MNLAQAGSVLSDQVTGLIKPPGMPSINWLHPRSQGLVFYGYDTGDGDIVDLVANLGSAHVPGATRAGQKPSAWGMNIAWNTGDAIFFNVNPLIQQVTAAPPWTAACAFVPSTLTVSDGVVFGRLANNGKSAPFGNWRFDTNFNGAGASIFGFIFDNNGSEGTIGTNGIAVGQYFTVAAVAVPGSVTLYVNGSVAGTAAATIASSNTAGSDAIIFAGSNASAVGGNFGGVVPWGAFWRRALTPAEIVEIGQNPYRNLLYPQRNIIGSVIDASSSGMGVMP